MSKKPMTNEQSLREDLAYLSQMNVRLRKLKNGKYFYVIENNEKQIRRIQKLLDTTF